MKRFIKVAIVIGSVFVSTVSIAQDMLITGKLENVSQKISKNGNPYVVLSVPENRELNGIKYTTSVGIFAFNNEEAKKLKVGDSVKLVAKKSVDKSTGNEFYTLISIVK